jgi:hypothetical protein
MKMSVAWAIKKSSVKKFGVPAENECRRCLTVQENNALGPDLWPNHSAIFGNASVES